ncbi:MAG TPA: hypothetical protein VML55_19470 [Planctomycetaceae bacterium]|nr:hypothetical protein [Planctomycetaceae bacterium]
MLLSDWLARYRMASRMRTLRRSGVRRRREAFAFSRLAHVEVLESRIALGDVLGLASAFAGGGAGARA